MNAFTDFFETLLPREFSVYVIPGSVALAAINLAAIDFYKIDRQYLLLRNFFTQAANFKAHDYIFGTLLWIALAYVVGLIIGALVEAIRFLWKQTQKKPYSVRKKTVLSGRRAMYVSLHNQMMYRREIERYGVIVRSIENMAVALGIWAILALIWWVILALSNDADSALSLLFIGANLVILVILIVLLLYGAKGYKKLQYFRIKTLYWALLEEEKLTKSS